MKKKGLYFIDVPVYEREISVLIGLSHSDALKEAKKQKCKKSFIECLNEEETKSLIEKVYNNEETEAAVTRVDMRLFLILRKPKNTWFFLDVLNHETFHLTQFMSKQMNLWFDNEPPAYLHSWLFRRLRKFILYEK